METTRDTLLGGAVEFVQPARGYRVNVDTVLLAAFAATGPGARRVVDLGAGVGAVSLALFRLRPFGEVHALERDADLAELCRSNFLNAEIKGRVLVADVAALPRSLAASADLVVANPPFFEPSERRAAHACREPMRAGALEPFVRAARKALSSRRGRAAFVYPARTLTRLLNHAESVGLVPKRLRFVHPFATERARVALVELKIAKPGGLEVEAPLFEWRSAGQPTAEFRAFIAGRASDRK